MKLMPLAKLVLDYSVYPRMELDTQHVHYMQLAYQAGAPFPPLVVCAKSKRLVDGFHRVEMYRREEVESVEVILKNYRNEQEVFLDSIRYNAGHGRALSTFDRTHCALRAQELKIAPAELAEALRLTPEAVGQLIAERVGRLRSAYTLSGVQIPLKRTVSHLAGKTLTKSQEAVNGKLSGMDQGFYVQQLILLLESGMANLKDAVFIARLRKLHEILDSVLVAK